MVCEYAGNRIGIQVGGTLIMISVNIRCPIDQEKNETQAYCCDGQFQVFHGRSQLVNYESV